MLLETEIVGKCIVELDFTPPCDGFQFHSRLRLYTAVWRPWVSQSSTTLHRHHMAVTSFHLCVMAVNFMAVKTGSDRSHISQIYSHHTTQYVTAVKLMIDIDGGVRVVKSGGYETRSSSSLLDIDGGVTAVTLMPVITSQARLSFILTAVRLLQNWRPSETDGRETETLSVSSALSINGGVMKAVELVWATVRRP